MKLTDFFEREICKGCPDIKDGDKCPCQGLDQAYGVAARMYSSVTYMLKSDPDTVYGKDEGGRCTRLEVPNGDE